MSTNQEQSEQLERYLAGEMPEAEREAFEAALERDPELTQALALHRALRHSLGDKERRRLLDAMADVVEQEDKKRSASMLQRLSLYRMAVAAVLLMCVAAVGVWLYLRPRVEPPAVAEGPVVFPQPRPDSSATEAGPSPAEQIPKPELQPIASTDRRAFEPNPALDPLVGTLVRGGNVDIQVTNPGNDAVLPLRNGKINFTIAGNAGGMNALTLHMYNNREADFVAGKAEYQYEMPVNNQVFAWNKTLSLVPGRYYAVLSAPGDEEPAVVLRFYVGSR